MLRGIVLGLSLTLAAVLQLVATPSASADGGLLSGLAEILTPGGDAADAPAEPEDPGLLGGLLDTVDDVTEPLTDDLLDPATDTLDPLSSALDAPLTESLDETIAGLTETLTEALPMAPAPEPVAPAPVASSDTGGAPGTPLEGAGTILNALLEPAAPQAADTITAVSEPLEPIVAGVAPLVVGDPEPLVPGLLPLIPAGETLGPVVSVLRPILEPAVRLTSAVVRPVVMLVEPVATPVLRSLDRVLQPVAGLLQPVIIPVVDESPAPAPAIEPAPAPGTGEPPPLRAASTAGIPSLLDGAVPVQIPALARSAVLVATASLQALEISGAQTVRTGFTMTAPLRVFEDVVLRANAERNRTMRGGSGASSPLLNGLGPNEDDSSSKFQAPVAALPPLIVLMLTAYLLFTIVFSARSQSWLKRPVRPPI